MWTELSMCLKSVELLIKQLEIKGNWMVVTCLSHLPLYGSHALCLFLVLPRIYLVKKKKKRKKQSHLPRSLKLIRSTTVAWSVIFFLLPSPKIYIWSCGRWSDLMSFLVSVLIFHYFDFLLSLLKMCLLCAILLVRTALKNMTVGVKGFERISEKEFCCS